MDIKCQEARDNPSRSHGGDRKSSIRKVVQAARDTIPDQGCNATLKRGTVDYTLRRLARDNPEAKQEDIAKMFGVSQPYVSQVISKTSESEETIIPDHINGNSDKADYNKLPAELREKVAAREVSLNQAAIQAGIRKKPTAEEQCVRLFLKCDDKPALLMRLQELANQLG